jgi:hypothetical protein
VEIFALLKQVSKYKNAVKKCLDEQFQDERTKEIEIVCLLEKPPTPREDDETNKRWCGRSTRGMLPTQTS